MKKLAMALVVAVVVIGAALWFGDEPEDCNELERRVGITLHEYCYVDPGNVADADYDDWERLGCIESMSARWQAQQQVTN